MKIPNRVLGFVDFNGEKLPFEFNKKEFVLSLYYISEEESRKHYFDGFRKGKVDPKEHKWIDKLIINGRTSEGYAICFRTQDSSSTYNGYYTYNIDWYYIYDKPIELVDEIRIFGVDIDYFYDSTRLLNDNIKYNIDTDLTLKLISANIGKVGDLYCGEYDVEENHIRFSCSSNVKIHESSNTALKAESFLKVEISKSTNIERIVGIVSTISCFIMYVCYRRNIYFSNIKTYFTDESGIKRDCGILVFNKNVEFENCDKDYKRIIKAEYLNNHTADLIRAIENEEITLEHICKSVDDRLHYPISRIIMILSAFEREFRNIYGQDTDRAEEYIKAKGEIVEIILKHADKLSGKRRKYYKSIAKLVKDSDLSYGDKFKHALSDCKNIMEPILTGYFEGEYEKIVDDVSESVNKLRNEIAHNSLDCDIEARNLVDIFIVEEMLYVIRLKKVGIEDLFIKRILNELFKI